MRRALRDRASHLCRGSLELLVPSVCPGCDAPCREGDALLCERCALGIHALPVLRGVCTATAYEHTVATLLPRFKYEGRRDALPLFTELLAERTAGLRFDAIVPVPRHRTRIRSEGSDPVYVLARALGQRVGRPVLDRVLRRTRRTQPQTARDPQARRVNVQGSFMARPGALRGRRVLLLDDVTTTGATLAEARRTLGAALPRAVIPAALAATPLLAV